MSLSATTVISGRLFKKIPLARSQTRLLEVQPYLRAQITQWIRLLLGMAKQAPWFLQVKPTVGPTMALHLIPGALT